MSALIGTTDASSFLGTNENNVDFAVFGPGNLLWRIELMNLLEKICI